MRRHENDSNAISRTRQGTQMESQASARKQNKRTLVAAANFEEAPYRMMSPASVLAVDLS